MRQIFKMLLGCSLGVFLLALIFLLREAILVGKFWMAAGLSISSILALIALVALIISVLTYREMEYADKVIEDIKSGMPAGEIFNEIYQLYREGKFPSPLGRRIMKYGRTYFGQIMKEMRPEKIDSIYDLEQELNKVVKKWKIRKR